MEEAPLGITPPEIADDGIHISDRIAEAKTQLDRAVATNNETQKELAVEAVEDLLKPENLQTVPGERSTNTAQQIIDLLPPLHELAPEVAEEKIVELAVDPSLIRDQGFGRNLQEAVAAVRSDEPLADLAPVQVGLAIAEASVEVHSQRDVHYPAEEVDESKKKD